MSSTSQNKYEPQLGSMRDGQLRALEVKLLQAKHAHAYRASLGLGVAIATLGTIIPSIDGAWSNHSVCAHMLVLVRQELGARGIPLHRFGWRDFVMPMSKGLMSTAVASILGLELDCGDFGLVDVVDAGSVADDVEVEAEVLIQLTEGGGGPLPTQTQAPAPAPAPAVPAGNIAPNSTLASANYAGAGLVAGFWAQNGLLLAHSLSSHIVMTFDLTRAHRQFAQAAQGDAQYGQSALATSTWIAETIPDAAAWGRIVAKLGCRRLLTPFAVVCNSCETAVEKGPYKRE
ncbi:hypothetical protein PG993_011795 [Apiospora rasikravindrae]|uniref:Uncharacterized protein n=1 Tax=Apiospora rasikravindrae TaxID=990691 RepID=A0ABR1S0M1_9PEZI